MRFFSSKKTLTLLLLCLFSKTYGQVTIGHNTPPIPGALLQLKENNNLDGTQINSSRGLLMPRLPLKLKKLPSGSNVISTINTSITSTWDASSHVGLVVYNTATIESENLCPGLYVWKGTEWEELSKGCKVKSSLTIPGGSIYFPSGLGSIPIKEEPIKVEWEPATKTVTITNQANPANNGKNPSIPEVSFDQPSPFPYTTSPGGSTTINFKPKPFSPSELAGNPFLSKESEIIFQVNDGSSNPPKESMIINQTHKALLVNNSKNPEAIDHIVAGPHTLNVKSNAKWKVASVTGTSIQDITTTLTGGEEFYDGKHKSENFNYTMRIGNIAYSKFNYVVFADQNTPKRFDDVIYVATQCKSPKDLTMEEYKKIWEIIYNSGNTSQPDTNGNSGRNKNGVQWHRDQDGNIFFSALFNGVRWMTTNLRALTYTEPKTMNGKTYTTLTAEVSYTQNLLRRSPKVYHTGTTSSTTTIEYSPRVGFLYNWAAAMGGDRHVYNLPNFDYQNIQGICPTGWHIPSKAETVTLIAEMQSNALNYSYNDNFINTGTSMKEACQLGDGKSFTFLEGGFSLQLGGDYNNGVHNYEKSGTIWTSNTGDTQAYGTEGYTGREYITANGLQVNKANPLQTGYDLAAQVEQINVSSGYSVRCIKNTP